MTAFHAYLFGVWTMMGIVLLHEIVAERRRKRRERASLLAYSKILGVKPRPDETNEEIEKKLRTILRGPFR